MAIRAALMLFAFAAVGLFGAARAQDDPACAKDQDPLAYNACLASHGPKATDIGTNPALAQGAHAAPVRSGGDEPAAAPRSQRIWAHAARRRGRAHMEFRVK
jgi:hypothetical protein